MTESENHRGALLRAQSLLHVVDAPEARHAELRLATSAHRQTVWRAIAAVATVVITLASAVGLSLFDDRDTWRTAIGERREIPLDDGSTIAVNTASEVSADLSAKRRDVSLAYGEAVFRVAPQKARPFIVSTLNYEIIAVGTVFGVRIDPSSKGSYVNVLVDEGIVEVRRTRDKRVVGRLTAGMRGSFGIDVTQMETLPPATIARQLAWRNGHIDLAGEPLSTAVAEMNRYNSRPIRLADPTITGRSFHGVFRTDDSLGFARTVSLALQVPVKVGGTEIVIGRHRSN